MHECTIKFFSAAKPIETILANSFESSHGALLIVFPRGACGSAVLKKAGSPEEPDAAMNENLNERNPAPRRSRKARTQGKCAVEKKPRAPLNTCCGRMMPSDAGAEEGVLEPCKLLGVISEIVAGLMRPGDGEPFFIEILLDRAKRSSGYENRK
jgi:hypothetical protein